ncbi:MAG TPA: hypothetical protein VIR58_14565 [Acidimicrobiales bacterium]
MRTTINLHDGLAEAAKRRAREDGRTFTSLVEEGLRRVLDQPSRPSETVTLPSFGDPTARPLVDLDDRDAVWEILDSNEA